MMKSRSGGFTLIELLAVITIMGILMMVAIPTISRTIENARKDTFVNTAKQYADSARTMWNSDSLSCSTAEGSFNSSTMPAGDYYIEINTDAAANVPILLEQGGKSPWGNRNIKGFVKVVVTELSGLYGDVNHNGYIDSYDFIMVKRYVLNNDISSFSSFDFKLADVTGDGRVTSDDFEAIESYFYSGGGNRLPITENGNTVCSFREVKFYPIITDDVHGVNVEKNASGDVGVAATLTDAEELVRGSMLMNDATYDAVVIPADVNMCVER